MCHGETAKHIWIQKRKHKNDAFKLRITFRDTTCIYTAKTMKLCNTIKHGLYLYQFGPGLSASDI